MLDKASIDDMDEVPVQSSINEANKNFRRAVPVFIDVDISMVTSVLASK